MAETITDKDVRALVGLLQEGRRVTPAIGLPQQVLELTQTLVRCDELSFLEIEPASQTFHLEQGPTDTFVKPDYGITGEVHPFWVHFWDTPSCSYSVATGDQRTITTISDFYSRRQWHSSGMYVDCLSRYGVEESAVMSLSSPAGISRRLVFFRCGGSDFDQRDRLLLALLRPHLDELYQDLQRRRQPELGLSIRQRQLLGFVAAGYSNSEIARELLISAATVRTHLERIFKLLNVTNRSAAVARAFPPSPY
jgi:DNA-binding CsgD family transcriptional regulator